MVHSYTSIESEMKLKLLHGTRIGITCLSLMFLVSAVIVTGKERKELENRKPSLEVIKAIDVKVMSLTSDTMVFERNGETFRLTDLNCGMTRKAKYITTPTTKTIQVNSRNSEIIRESVCALLD